MEEKLLVKKKRVQKFLDNMGENISFESFILYCFPKSAEHFEQLLKDTYTKGYIDGVKENANE